MKGDSVDLLRTFYEAAVMNHPNKQSLLRSFNAFATSFGGPPVFSSQRTLDIPLDVVVPRNRSIRSSSRIELGTEELEKTKSSNQDKASLKPPERNENLPTKDSGSGPTDSRSLRSGGRGAQLNIKDLIISLQTFYSCEWIYLHQQIDRVLIYYCFTCFLGSGNGIALSRFQAKLKKRTPQLKVSSSEMDGITKDWAIIQQTINSRKKGKWQKIFKGVVDRFPVDFVKLMVQVIAGKQSYSDVPNRELLNSFAKELKMSLLLLQIEYKTIQRQEVFGTYPIELPLVIFWKGKMFGVANKRPQYSVEERNCDYLRASWVAGAEQIRSMSERNTLQLLETGVEINYQSKEEEISKLMVKFSS